MGFTSILVVIVRLYWFNKHLTNFGKTAFIAGDSDANLITPTYPC
jgi:hypothetical protein